MFSLNQKSRKLDAQIVFFFSALRWKTNHHNSFTELKLFVETTNFWKLFTLFIIIIYVLAPVWMTHLPTYYRKKCVFLFCSQACDVSIFMTRTSVICQPDGFVHFFHRISVQILNDADAITQHNWRNQRFQHFAGAVICMKCSFYVDFRHSIWHLLFKFRIHICSARWDFALISESMFSHWLFRKSYITCIVLICIQASDLFSMQLLEFFFSKCFSFVVACDCYTTLAYFAMQSS